MVTTGDIKLVFQEKLSTAFDVYLLNCERFVASGGLYRCLCFITKMTTGARVNNHMSF
jgi:hypothetical protein